MHGQQSCRSYRVHTRLFPDRRSQEHTPLVLAGDTLTPISPPQSDPPSSAFSAGVPQAPPVQPASTGALAVQASRYATATAQISPTTSGKLTLTEVEQQCDILLRQ